MNCPLCDHQEVCAFVTLKENQYLDCPRCHLLFLHEEQRLSSEKERTRYELHQNSENDPGYRNFLSPLVEALTLKLQPGMVGLDFGSGPGPALPAMMKEKGFTTERFDPFFSPDRKVLDEKYDFVSCTEVIEHLFYPEKELALIDSLLISGGWLGIMTHFFDDREPFAGSHYRRDETHVCFYSTRTFEFVAEHFAWTAHFPTKNVVLFQK